jgi:hypothetical protein
MLLLISNDIVLILEYVTPISEYAWKRGLLFLSRHLKVCSALESRKRADDYSRSGWRTRGCGRRCEARLKCEPAAN